MAKLPIHPIAVGGRRVAPALVLATALVATGLSFAAARSVAEAQTLRRFDRTASASAAAITDRMDAYLGMLRASAGLVAALGRPPTVSEFHAAL